MDEGSTNFVVVTVAAEDEDGVRDSLDEMDADVDVDAKEIIILDCVPFMAAICAGTAFAASVELSSLGQIARHGLMPSEKPGHHFSPSSSFAKPLEEAPACTMISLNKVAAPQLT